MKKIDLDIFLFDSVLPSDLCEKLYTLGLGMNTAIRLDLIEEDKELFHALPNKVTVYRGCQEGYEEGWSFTTNYEIAKWFALRKPQFTKPRIVHATVYKKDIIAYFHERYEAEVLAEKHEFNHIEILEHIPDYKMDLMDLVSNLSM